MKKTKKKISNVSSIKIDGSKVALTCVSSAKHDIKLNSLCANYLHEIKCYNCSIFIQLHSMFKKNYYKRIKLLTKDNTIIFVMSNVSSECHSFLKVN